MIDGNKLSKSARRAIGKYGAAVCREAYRRNVQGGEGAHTISLTMPGAPRTVNGCDAAINAGAELAAQS